MAGRTPSIAVNMIDRDIIERLAALVRGRAYGPYDRSHVNPAHRPIWRAQVNGPQSAAWMMTLFPLFGTRRREQVRRGLDGRVSVGHVRGLPAGGGGRAGGGGAGWVGGGRGGGKGGIWWGA